MILNSPQRSLEVIVATIPATPWTWTVDFNVIPQVGKPAQPSTADGTIPSAAAVTMIPAPAQNETRIVTAMSVLNADATAQIVTVRLNNNGAYRNYFSGLMSAGDQLTYQVGRGFFVLDASGNAKGISPTTGLVDDGQQSYVPTTYQALSLTPDGRLRVTETEGYPWRIAFTDPWQAVQDDNPTFTKSPRLVF